MGCVQLGCSHAGNQQPDSYRYVLENAMHTMEILTKIGRE